MTLYFRLLLIFIKSLFKKQANPMGPIYSHFRVWPSDLDVLGHMTNSRYFNLMDAARTDLIFRAGFVSKLKERGWYPIVVEESMHFRRALLPFVKFQIKTEITGYDDRHIILRQTFLKQGKVVALGVVRARFMGPNKQKVTPAELIGLVENREIPELPIPISETEKYRYHKDAIEEENGKLLEKVKT